MTEDNLKPTGLEHGELIEICNDLIKRYTTSHVITDTAVICAKELRNRLIEEVDARRSGLLQKA